MPEQWSEDARYPVGRKVVLTGWGIGEGRWGGLAQKVVVNGDHLVPLPDGLSNRDAMAIGTGGLTTMLCVLALERALGLRGGLGRQSYACERLCRDQVWQRGRSMRFGAGDGFPGAPWHRSF